jgi:hypothetical protein
MNAPARLKHALPGRMPRRLAPALLLLVIAISCATVLREPIAQAAQLVDASIVGPLDGQGNVKVHEQGTALVHERGTATVDVTNPTLPVEHAGMPVTIRLGFPGDDTQYAVPRGKRLVIQYVNAQDVVTPTNVETAVHVRAGTDLLHAYRFVGDTFDLGDSVLRVVSEPVLIHADEGQRIVLVSESQVELSGYLVTA